MSNSGPAVGPTSQSATYRLQSITLLAHIWILSLVVISVTVLTLYGKLTSDAASGALVGIIGFAGGAISARSGARASERQTSD